MTDSASAGITTMHGDKKLGLALGVLLVGIVGAFFFRNEPVPELVAPELADPQVLDSQIAEKPLVPYLTGMEPAVEPASSAPQGASALRPGHAFGSSEFDPFRADPPVSLNPPGPIPLTAHDRAVPGRPTSVKRPDPNSGWQAVGDSDLKNTAGPPERVWSDEARMHQVQPGDTLSGLALRYLGSSVRFQDIYAANRNVLKSPDDLRVGMKLRIPSAGESRASQALVPRTAGPAEARRVSSGPAPQPLPSERPQPADAMPPSDASRPPDRLFRPVPRSPLMPHGTGSSRSELSTPAKSLSQVPPRDLPVLD